MINSGDVRWDVTPVDTSDAESPTYLAALSREELLEWAFGAQDDIEALRFTLKRSLAALHDVVVERDALRRALRQGRR